MNEKIRNKGANGTISAANGEILNNSAIGTGANPNGTSLSLREAKILPAREAFAEVQRLHENRENGCVVNIAERKWLGCGRGDAFKAGYDFPVFHSDYHADMCDLILEGDLAIWRVERVPSAFGQELFRRVAEFLQSRGIHAYPQSGDFHLLMGGEKPLKIGSYASLYCPAHKMYETSAHIYLRADDALYRAVRKFPPDMARKGLGDYGITAKDILRALG